MFDAVHRVGCASRREARCGWRGGTVSHPTEEGRAFADELRAAGLTVELVADAAAPTRVAEASLLLVGADTVFRDGALCNKTGTRPLAQAAAGQRVPMRDRLRADQARPDRQRASATAPTASALRVPLQIVAGAGHLSMLAKPNATAAAILRLARETRRQSVSVSRGPPG